MSVSLICSREVAQRIHLCLIHYNTFTLHSFMTATLNPVSSDHFHLQSHLLHSVSYMWDSLRPSYDGSLLVDISSLSNPFSTLKLACLNGKFLTSGDRFTSMAFDERCLTPSPLFTACELCHSTLRVIIIIGDSSHAC